MLTIRDLIDKIVDKKYDDNLETVSYDGSPDDFKLSFSFPTDEFDDRGFEIYNIINIYLYKERDGKRTCYLNVVADSNNSVVVDGNVKEVGICDSAIECYLDIKKAWSKLK